MATIEKRGKSYRIIVSNGYDINGKQIREKMTWTPEPGMTPAKIKKELARQAALFEDKIHHGAFLDNRIKFADFAQKYMDDYGALHLKAKTFRSYTENLVKINAALGHIKLCDLKPTHINAFYKNLQEAGMRDATTAICKLDLVAHLQDQQLSVSKFAAAAGLSRSTIKAAMEKKHIAKESAEKIAAAMGTKLTTAFTLERDMEPLAAATVLAYHRTLSAVLTKAVQWGYLNTNPADRAEKPKLGRKEAAYLDEADARRLLELLQGEPIRWRALITFDLLSGLRRGELLGLRWQDVDIDAQMIQIRQTSNYLPGLGVYTGTPKTSTSRRPLKLSKAAMLLLLEYQRWQNTQRTALGDAWEDRDGRVFTTDSGAPIFPDSVTQWFSQFVQRTGLPPVTVHSLRHTYASLMIADGTPLVVVSHQLGHAQTSTTANIYAHVIAAAETKAQEAMDDRFKDLIAPSEINKKAAGE